MQTHVKAREIFFRAVRFIPQHISFTVYYFLLMGISELLQVARTINMDQRIQEITHSEGYPIQTPSFIGSFWRALLSPEIIALLQKPYIPYIIFALTFVLMILFVSITFIAQALLRKRATSIMHETRHSFSALMRAPWALMYLLLFVALMTIFPYFATRESVAAATTPFVFLPLFVLLFLFMFISVPLYYFQPLLYDNYYSFKSVLYTSWTYVKKSWFLLLKLVFLTGALSMLVMSPFMFFEGLSSQSTILTVVQFALRAYVGLLGVVGFNMIYNHVRS